jgi:hypothetical protein
LSVQVIQIGSESGIPYTLESHTLGNGLYLSTEWLRYCYFVKAMPKKYLLFFFPPIRKKEGKDKDKRYRTDPPASGPRKRKKRGLINIQRSWLLIGHAIITPMEASTNVS